MFGRLFKVLLFLGICGAAVAGVFYHQLSSWSTTSVRVDEPKIVSFPKGTGLAVLAASLHQAGVIDNPTLFRLWIKIEGTYPRFQAGQYRFEGTFTPDQVADKVMSGDVFHPVVVQYTIPEGFTLKQVIDRLVANKVGTRAELTRLVKDADFLSALKIKAETLEGYIYPATYSYIKRVTARDALQHMVETFWNKMPKNYQKRVQAKGLTLHEAVTFASLIELETKHDDEKSLISEVIWARLDDKVPLAIDASIIYGIKDYAGDLKWKHLADASNPYNSRIHRGLPPGPIGAPSASSMEAVLNPTNQGHYYYVLKPESDRHHFSKTLKEHNRHVKKLVEAIRRNRRR